MDTKNHEYLNEQLSYANKSDGILLSQNDTVANLNTTMGFSVGTVQGASPM
jgi:hypothetical protein